MLEFGLIITQSVGVLAAAGDIYAALHKNDRRFMVIIALSSLVWGLHYALLGAWAAVGSDLLTVSRYISALYWKKKSIAYTFMAFYAGAIPITYTAPVDVLPYASGFISTYALFFLHGIKMRLVFVCGHTCWLVYALTQASIPGIVLNALMILSHIRTILGLWQDAKQA